MKQKAQGTIEYLVIIAIVIVIALVVVGLLLQVMNSGSGVPETQAKATWKSAEPLAIIDWGVNGTAVTLVLRNNSAESITVNRVTLNSSDKNDTVDKTMAPGSTYTVRITDATGCTAGSKYSYPKEDIDINYNTTNINNKRQNALADIIGTC